MSVRQRDAILALDLGTSSLKALLVATDGRVLASSRHPYPTTHPEPGFAEQDPDDWWQATVAAVSAARDAGSVAAISVTGQMHGTVLLDDALRPLGPAIIWADERSAQSADDLTARLGAEQIHRLCGSPLFAGVQAATLAWLRAEEPKRWQKTRHVLLPKDWLAFRLTGTLATEPSDAAGTLLFASEGRDWASPILDALTLDRDWLPDVIPSGSVMGNLARETANDLGLPAETPVILAGGDAPCGAVAAGARHPSRAIVLLSTGAQVIQAATDFTPDPTGRIHVWPAALPGSPRWNRMGATLNAGLAVEWAHTISGFATSADVLDAAADVPAGASGLLFLPYLIGERTPLMDADACGVLFGFGVSHGPPEIARAVVEGITFSLSEALAAVTDGEEQPAEILLGGGLARHSLWSRLLADGLGVPVRTLAVADLSTYGAAMLAAHGLGWIDVLDPPAVWQQMGNPVAPNAEEHQRYRDQFAIARELFQRTRPLSERVAALTEARQVRQ